MSAAELVECGDGVELFDVLPLDGPRFVVSRTQLEEKLYGWKDEISSNAVEVYVHGLRKKLGADLIRNVRGVGYMVPKQG